MRVISPRVLLRIGRGMGSSTKELRIIKVDRIASYVIVTNHDFNNS